ncbi:helix-turn-helix transcriptional regulator [Solibacillus ferritrahens]|uniref:helix-turn-helix transcriptional regulator n=1 Tax=Solibacillus ferritrahens TaxID=3098620 RepID=UPI00300B21A7
MELTATTIKDYRYHYGITQETLARKLGVTQSYIAHIESGSREIPGYFAKQLGITAELVQVMQEVKAERLSLFPQYQTKKG